MLFRNYRNYQSCPQQLEHLGLLSGALITGLGFFLLGLFTHFLACCALSISPDWCPRVCAWVVDCIWGDQSANVKNKLNIHKLSRIPLEGNITGGGRTSEPVQQLPIRSLKRQAYHSIISKLTEFFRSREEIDTKRLISKHTDSASSASL